MSNQTDKVTRRLIAWVLAAGAVMVGVTAEDVLARTWRVERDGSGDFTVIQDAVNAAASGDTIRIGPGRFNEGQVVSTPGWTEFVRVLVTQAELTLIGSGDSTIIGQEEPWDLSQGWHHGIAAVSWFGNIKVSIERLSFQNLGRAIKVEDNQTQVADCQFVRNYMSITTYNGQLLLVARCRFEYTERDGRHVIAIGQTDVMIMDSEFVQEYSPQWGQVHISMNNVASAYIENCRIDGGTAGLSSGGPVCNTRVVDSDFNSQSLYSAAAGVGGTLTMEGCSFRNPNIALGTWDQGVLIISRCVVESVIDCSIRVTSTMHVFVNECDLAAGTGGTVQVAACFYSPPPTLDFRDNYWGTDDPDQIANLINDRNDDPAVCSYVNFIPFRSHSVPVQQQTWSEIKGLFKN